MNQQKNQQEQFHRIAQNTAKQAFNNSQDAARRAEKVALANASAAQRAARALAGQAKEAFDGAGKHAAQDQEQLKRQMNTMQNLPSGGDDLGRQKASPGASFILVFKVLFAFAVLGWIGFVLLKMLGR